jgi:CRISPR-associated exonuclease Cas4
VALAGTTGVWQPFPVEHKVGKLRHERAYEVQLCAQALCLEEMLGVLVPAGAIFFGKTFRRQEVYFDQSLRGDTESAARLLHEIVCSGKTPRARYEKKCRECSLLSLCLPNITARERSVRSYINKALNTEADEAS